MSIHRIECAEKECPYGRSNCCFGEVEAETIPPGCEDIKERHKCKAKKGKTVIAKYNLTRTEKVG